jgi:uncharacterized OB-fold protein
MFTKHTPKVIEVDGVRVMCNISEHDPAKLKIGMEMQLEIGSLFVDDDGNDVIGFQFRPVSK